MVPDSPDTTTEATDDESRGLSPTDPLPSSLLPPEDLVAPEEVTPDQDVSAAEKTIDSPGATLRRRYVSAVVILLVLLCGAQAAVQFAIRRQTSDAPVINIAGRQRMLSQKITKCALRLRTETAPYVRAATLEELEQSLHLFTSSHEGLLHGNVRMHLPELTDEGVLSMFAELQGDYDGLRKSADKLLVLFDVRAHGDPRDIAAATATLNECEAKFLKQMNAIVFALEDVASERVLWLGRLEWTLFALTIAVLGLEVAFVFEPAVRILRQQFGKAVEATRFAEENERLQQMNARLESMIEQRLDAQRKFRKQSDLLKTIVEQAPYGICWKDTSSIYLGGNSAFCDIAGVSGGDGLPGKTDFDLFDSDEAHASRREDLELFATGRPVRGREVTRNVDGAEVIVSITKHPLRDGSGGVIGLVGIASDVTQQKENERVLIEQRETACEANRAKSDFLAHMSHELRTPLNAILGFTQLLRGDTLSVAERTEHVDTIHRSGEHLLTLVNDILDLSRIEANELQLADEAFCVHRVVTEVISLLRVRALEAGIGLEYEWATVVPRTIRGDSDRLRQLLVNLVGNAIKFTHAGEVRIVCAFEPDAEPAQLRVEVRDTGVGIAEEHLAGIFEAFDQGETGITRAYGGTGLGLAICRRIVEAFGGDITVRSQVGVGSTFALTLPTGPVDGRDLLATPPVELLTPIAALDEPALSLTGRRVLVVDDGETNRKLVRLILERAGAEVTCAEDGREGSDLAIAEEFDIVLMDMQMPVMDGLTATQRIRGAGRTVPVMALTASAMPESIRRYERAGCTNFLSKPIDTRQLIDLVERMTSASDEANAQPESAVFHSGAVGSSLPTQDPALRELVEGFLTELQSKLPEFDAAYATGDWERLRRAAHWLSGCGGTAGYAPLSDVARELESAATDGAVLRITTGIQELRELTERLVVAVP